MKKLILLFLSVLMMMPIVNAKELQVQDTTVLELENNRYRYYHYPEWWDTVNSYCNDTLQSKITMLTGYGSGAEGYTSYQAREMVVKRPIKVYGMAVMIHRHPESSNSTWLNEDRVAEYVWMAHYNAVADSMEPFAISRWDTAAVKIMPLQFACDSAHMSPIYINSGVYDSCYIYEAYFDEPVVVDSTYWAVGTEYNNKKDRNQLYYYNRPISYYYVYQQGRPWSRYGGCEGHTMLGVNNTGWSVDIRCWGMFLPIVEYQYLMELDAFEDYGQVLGGGWYEDSTEVEVTAVPNPGMIFSHWSDGSTENPRTVTILSDTNITAYFVDDPNTRSVSAISDNLDMGVVTGGGYYPDSTIVELRAVPGERYLFTHWSDGDTNNPKYYKVASDTTFRAYFVKNPDYVKRFEVIVRTNNPKFGVVSGNGIYDSGSVAHIKATPLAGCDFIRWSDHVYDELERDILVDKDMEFIAYFTKYPEGIAEVETEKVTLLPNPSQSQVNITTESVINNLECYDLSGKLRWREAPKSNRALLNVSQWTPGIYVVKITTERGVTVKKLVVQ